VPDFLSHPRVLAGRAVRYATMCALLLTVAAASCPTSIDLSTICAHGRNSDGSCVVPPNIPTQTILPGAARLGSMAFANGFLVIRAGHQMAWFNSDSVAHQIVIDSTAISTAFILPGDTVFIHVPSDTGEFMYHCTIHPAMASRLQVVP
jgi:hypothetical protein